MTRVSAVPSPKRRAPPATPTDSAWRLQGWAARRFQGSVPLAPTRTEHTHCQTIEIYPQTQNEGLPPAPEGAVAGEQQVAAEHEGTQHSRGHRRWVRRDRLARHAPAKQVVVQSSISMLYSCGYSTAIRSKEVGGRMRAAAAAAQHPPLELAGCGLHAPATLHRISRIDGLALWGGRLGQEGHLLERHHRRRQQLGTGGSCLRVVLPGRRAHCPASASTPHVVGGCWAGGEGRAALG